MTEQSNHSRLLRHMLKTIQCRMNGVIEDASAEFAAFSIGEGTRTPIEILSHVGDVLSFSIEQVDPGSFSFEQGSSGWQYEVSRYRAALFELDRALSKQCVSENLMHRLSQGPIADVLTHVGQLALLRGLAGQRVPAQEFFTLDLPDVVPEGSA